MDLHRYRVEARAVEQGLGGPVAQQMPAQKGQAVGVDEPVAGLSPLWPAPDP